jgi:octaprenyl-diphosphate synthase
LMDDVLDYQASASSTGKMPGNDLLEGKFTLPLIHAMQQATTKDVHLLKEAIAEIQSQAQIDPREKSFSVILQLIEKTKSIDYTVTFAKREVKRATDTLKQLPPSAYREALAALAQFAVNRTS